MNNYFLPQVSYWIAYQLLPHYAFNAFDKICETWTKTPTSAGPFYYLMACQMGKSEPVREDAIRHTTEFGALGESHDYYLMQYPSPPAVDMGDSDPISLIESGVKIVLAPYFSAIIRSRDSGEIRYFVLGQAPIGGGTTLRTVTAQGANANLGPGPLPEKAQFLAALVRHIK